VKRTAYLVALLVFCAAAPAAGDAVRDDLAREILRRVPTWPKAQVEIPLEVYEKFVRDELLDPVPPKPPEAAWVERASWTVRPAEAETVVEVALDVVALPGLVSRHVRVLGADVAWRDVALDGKPLALRRGDDGWFWLDNPQPGRLRITAKAALKPKAAGDRRTIAWATAPAGWSGAAFESDAAWEARFSRSIAPIIGGDAGTRGTVGLVPGDRLEVTWQKPQPVVHRAAQIESAADIGWTLAEGVHQVRAVLALRLWGGEVAELTVDLPAGADRVSITGPDVREVQVSGGAARVFLRGPITQRTRLSVAFESPRAKTGRMSLPAFGVRGASPRGGTLAIAGGAGAVLLEMESPGLAPMAIHDLPDAVRGLLAAAPVYAYQLSGGAWEARIDAVDMAEFPVRETLADSALYTVLYRPDGSIMTKVLYEVRNRGQQYMKVDLPQGARLLVARVAEQQKNLARGPGETVFVPLEKSVLTMAGLISFPVELVYLTKGPPLARQGRLSLPLPRTDLPVAYARCALEVPDGLNLRRWQGTLREVPFWSGETAELEFEYGRGHLAAGLKPPEPKPAGKPQPRKPEKPTSPGILEAIGGLFVASQPKYNAVLLRNREEDKQRMAQDAQAAAQEERLSQEALVLQGKNSYRAGVEFYNRREYSKAAELFKKVIEVAPHSTEADNARKYLGNVEIALGMQDKGKAEDRGLRAQAKAVQLSQQSANTLVVGRQQELLAQAEQSLKAGKTEEAEAAYKVAVGLSGKLRAQGEEAREQDAVVRKAREFLQQREGERRRQQQELAQLQSQVQSLKQNIAEKGGHSVGAAIDALVEGRESGQPSPVLALPHVRVQDMKQEWPSAAVPGVEAPRLERPTDPLRPEPAGAQPRTAGAAAAARTPQPGGRQVQLGEAIAEQQVSRGKAGYTLLSPGADRAYGSMTVAGDATFTTDDALTAGDNRVEQLRRQVEELKTIHEELDAKGSVRGERVEDADADLRSGGKDAASLLGRKVTEKAKQVAAQAGQATELARQGRIAEAQDLIRNLEKDQEANVRAAQALAKTGAGSMTLERAMIPTFSDAAPRFEVASVLAAAAPPAPPPDVVAETGVPVSETGVPASDEWKALTETRRKLEEAKAAVAQKKQDLDKVQFNVRGLTRSSDEEKRLAEFVASNYSWALQPRSAAAGGGSGGAGGGAAPQAGPQPFRTSVTVTDHGAPVNLGAANAYTGATVVSGGTLTLNGIVVDAKAAARIVQSQGQVSLGGGAMHFDNGATRVDGVNDAVDLQVTNGNLTVANESDIAGNVEVVLERLRTNLGQRVAVGSRNTLLTADAARAAGIAWQQGANGVTYAVINEGQLLSLMDIEQRMPIGHRAAAPRGEVRQDAVVGTPAVLANGGLVSIDQAADDANTLSYNGNTLRVAHDDYLLVDNGGYLTAVKTGRMQHWATEAPPVRFPGVPAAVTVPVVGRTVKFEKTLLDPGDSLELVAEYTWQGEEK
jgi:autotransporter-associated beta strand protein